MSGRPPSTIGGMERYVIRGGREGFDRLRVLAAARRASTLELFQLAGLRPGMRCVDLGCGSGDVTLDMAALAGAAGWVAGIDADEHIGAKRAAEQVAAFGGRGLFGAENTEAHLVVD